jgi:hypothetical protein
MVLKVIGGLTSSDQDAIAHLDRRATRIEAGAPKRLSQPVKTAPMQPGEERGHVEQGNDADGVDVARRRRYQALLTDYSEEAPTE